MLLLQSEPPKTPLISIVIESFKEEPVEVPAKPLYTLEDKIKDNHYKCDENKQYIRADTAKCLDKPVYTQQSTVSTVTRAYSGSTASSGWYPTFQCTWHIWSKRSVGQWNDARNWVWQAQRDGWATGSTPRVGAVGVQPSINHVVYIERVDGGRVYVSDRNYDGYGGYDERWEPASLYTYIY